MGGVGCLYGHIYKWHARPGSNTTYLEQMILRKTLNMVIRFLLNSLSREVSLFLDLDLQLDLDLDLDLHLDLNLGQWLSRHV